MNIELLEQRHAQRRRERLAARRARVNGSNGVNGSNASLHTGFVTPAAAPKADQLVAPAAADVFSSPTTASALKVGSSSSSSISSRTLCASGAHSSSVTRRVLSTTPDASLRTPAMTMATPGRATASGRATSSGMPDGHGGDDGCGGGGGDGGGGGGGGGVSGGGGSFTALEEEGAVVSTCMQQALEEEGLEEGDDAADAPVAGLADLVGAAAAELMGFYLLSSVLMMRGSLPHEFRQVMSL